MGPVGRVTKVGGYFEIMGPSVFGRVKFCNYFLFFFRLAIWEAKFKGETERKVGK